MPRRLTVAATCALVVTLAGCTAAHADSLTLTDPSRDVWVLNHTARQPEYTRVPERRQADVRRTVIDHSDGSVVIRTFFFELRREDRYLSVSARLRTNTGMVRYANVAAGPRRITHRWRGESSLAHRAGAAPLDCNTSHRIHYTANRLVLRIPRTCLGNPRWIQGGGFSAATLSHGQVYTDDAEHEGPADRFGGFGRRIHHSTTPEAQAP